MALPVELVRSAGSEVAFVDAVGSPFGLSAVTECPASRASGSVRAAVRVCVGGGGAVTGVELLPNEEDGLDTGS